MALSSVAFVSDMHGNLPAFEAVLAGLEQRGPFDAIVGGGDFAQGGLYPAECLAKLRQPGWSCVRGNTDEWVLEAATNGRILAHDVPPEMADRSAELRAIDRFAADRLSSDDVDFLAGLPLLWTGEGVSGRRLAFAHATPWSSHPPVMPDATDERLVELLSAAQADTLLYGHIHRAYLRVVTGRTVGCIGAVGIPADGNPRPCFAVAVDDGDGWSVTHVRVDYDRAAYLEALEASQFPNAAGQAAMIRSAGM
jgi:predicted phosphodiesterase